MATVATVAIVGVTGCAKSEHAQKDGENGGTFVISTSSEMDYLFPPLVSTSQARGATELIFDYLASVGDSLNVIGDDGFIPNLAKSWTWANDSLSIAFLIHPDAKWHDGRPVRASDVQFTYRLYNDPALGSPSASLLSNIDSVSVRDSSTAVFWLKRKYPTSFYDVANQMLILPEHIYGTIPAAELTASELIRNPIGSGRFRFVRWVPNSVVEIASDTGNYRGRAKLDRVLWTVSPDFNTAVTKLMAGEADFFDAMRPDAVEQAAHSKVVRAITYPGFDYGFLMFNMRDPKNRSAAHPLFSDVNVRRALTMAVDRSAIVKNVLDTLAYVSVGPVLRAMPTTDTTVVQIPYNVAQATQLLDSIGWVLNKNGVREKNGRELSFTLITPSSSQNRVRSAVLIQDQFKRIGVTVKIQQLESNAFVRLETSRNFDAAMHSWHLDPSPSNIVQTWGTEAALDANGSNYGGYSNTRFDAYLDSALTAPSLERARPFFKRAYQIIIDDAPAIWIYELKGAVGIHRRVQVTSLRPDAWWAHLADWSIPANARIARDRTPPAAH